MLRTSVAHRTVKITATVAVSAPARDILGSIVVTAYSGRRVVATVTGASGQARQRSAWRGADLPRQATHLPAERRGDGQPHRQRGGLGGGLVARNRPRHLTRAPLRPRARMTDVVDSHPDSLLACRRLQIETGCGMRRTEDLLVFGQASISQSRHHQLNGGPKSRAAASGVPPLRGKAASIALYRPRLLRMCGWCECGPQCSVCESLRASSASGPDHHRRRFGARERGRHATSVRAH